MVPAVITEDDAPHPLIAHRFCHPDIDETGKLPGILNDVLEELLEFRFPTRTHRLLDNCGHLRIGVCDRACGFRRPLGVCRFGRHGNPRKGSISDCTSVVFTTQATRPAAINPSGRTGLASAMVPSIRREARPKATGQPGPDWRRKTRNRKSEITNSVTGTAIAADA